MEHELGKIELEVPVRLPKPGQPRKENTISVEELIREMWTRIATLEVQVAELQREMRNLNPGWRPEQR